ncbi:MAG TPA: ATP-binding protein [Nanoarchaeota archaeon]|nr:ATP-binding protein [Nanoarchaeota archaeon]
MYVGTVISTTNTPSTEKFHFVLAEDVIVKKGQFVVVSTEEGKVVARVSDIIKTNPYFERADSVKEFERSGKSLSELFPSERWEYLIGEAVPLGVYNENGELSRSFVPPSPGEKVYLAGKQEIFKFFGFDENGVCLGKVLHHDVEVKLNITRLLQKHLAILAMSGAGKSYLTTVLIEELIERKEEHGKIGIVLIDTHGEYVGFTEDEKYMDKTYLVLGKDFKIGVPSLSPQFFAEILPNMTAVQKRELTRLLAYIHEEKKGKPFDLTDLMEKLENDKIIKKSDTRNILYTYLSELNSTGLFGYYDNPPLDKLSRPGQLTIIDISDLTSQKEKQIIVSYIGRKLFEARRIERIPPTLLILEEAHNYAPEGVKKENAISRGIIEKIAREGRKFHVALCLISQRPINLSTTALSQCNTHIILRITNPYDLDHIGKTSEGITRDVLKIISSLQVGEALVVGEAVNYPLFFKVRTRKSKKAERGISLEEAALRFMEKQNKVSEDVKAFM